MGASQAFYDFKSADEDKPTSDLQRLPIVEKQGFRVVQLGKNLRNSGQILDHSYKIQEDNVIESAIFRQPLVEQSGFNEEQREVPGGKQSGYLDRETSLSSSLLSLYGTGSEPETESESEISPFRHQDSITMDQRESNKAAAQTIRVGERTPSKEENQPKQAASKSYRSDDQNLGNKTMAEANPAQQPFQRQPQDQPQ